MEKKTTTNADGANVLNALNGLDLNDVQSISSGGVSVTFKNNRGADDKAAAEAELIRRRAGYVPGKNAFGSAKWKSMG